MLVAAFLFLSLALASGALCVAGLPAVASRVASELTAISLAFSAIIAIACRGLQLGGDRRNPEGG
jgi:hypothetical protein